MKKLVTLAIAGAVTATTLNAVDIKGSGASFPYSVYQKWIKAYNKDTGIQVDYIKKGSSKGIKDITARSTNFGGSDKPLSPKKLQKAKLYQFPAVVGAITMAYNIPGVDSLKLSREAIVAIASGNVKYWDDAVIAKANKGVSLPHKKVTFVHRADGSGTTYNFTYYLSKVSKDWKKNFGAKKSLSWPGSQHIGGKANSGVAALLKQTKYSVGYADYAVAAADDMVAAGVKLATVENKAGNYIVPTLKSFQEGAAKASLDPKKDFYAMIADPEGAGSYPILASTFILVPQEAAATNKKVTAFYDWNYKNGQKIAEELGFVPLPDSLVKKIHGYWAEKGIK
jgi:phosphate transport system substrate-binding protein